MTPRPNVNHLLAIAALFAAGACGSGMLDVGFPAQVTGGGGASSGTSASYIGAMGDSLKHGTLTITVSPALAVTGVLTFAGGPNVTITGTVDTIAQQLTATGSGYTVTAFPSGGTLGGRYTGPTGNGFLVAAADSLTGQSHKTYCGAYTSTNSTGRLTVQVLSTGAASGFAVQTSGTALSSFFSGTVISNTELTAVTDQGVALSGSLSLDLSAITGTYAPPVAGSSAVNTATGTFSASVSGC
jgi:hypothetical protein